MSQQINLFNPIFLKQKKHFSALAMAQALGLILLGSIVMIAYASFQLSSLSKEAAATTAQLKATEAQLAKVSADYAPRQKDKALDAEVQKAEAEMKSRQQVFDLMQKDGIGNTKGYSEYLRAFSRQIAGGIWLTGFSISGAGSEIELHGRALQPDMVPAYIGRLKQEPVMQGKSFSTLAMQAPQMSAASAGDATVAKQRMQAGYIEFSLRSSDAVKEQPALPDANNLQPIGAMKEAMDLAGVKNQ